MEISAQTRPVVRYPRLALAVSVCAVILGMVLTVLIRSLPLPPVPRVFRPEVQQPIQSWGDMPPRLDPALYVMINGFSATRLVSVSVDCQEEGGTVYGFRSREECRLAASFARVTYRSLEPDSRNINRFVAALHLWSRAFAAAPERLSPIWTGNYRNVRVEDCRRATAEFRSLSRGAGGDRLMAALSALAAGLYACDESPLDTANVRELESIPARFPDRRETCFMARFYAGWVLLSRAQKERPERAWMDRLEGRWRLLRLTQQFPEYRDWEPYELAYDGFQTGQAHYPW